MSEKKFIDGIYNYCDRWCEKCTFTAHCSVYAELENDDFLDDNNMNDSKLWEHISDNFEKTIQLLHTLAKEHGIDLDNIIIDENELKDNRNSIDNHPIVKNAEAYTQLTMDFIDKHFDSIGERLNIIGNTEKFKEVGNALETISYYHFFINMKTRRALEGFLYDEQPAELEMNDSVGTAKILLISIDRTMAALVCLYSEISGLLDEILPLLAELEKMKKGLKLLFPRAMEFKRPGFDN